MRRIAKLGIVLATVGSMVIPASVAQAAGRRVTSSGGCTNSTAVWKMKAKSDDGRIEFEFEVDTRFNNKLWNVVVTDNGHTVFRGTRRTLAPSGSFDVERKVTNRSGVDHFVAVATRGSQRCVGRVNF